MGEILANASKHSAVSDGHCIEQMQLAETQITELLEKAEVADSAPLQDGLEWTLVSASCNLKRHFAHGMKVSGA